MEEIGPWSIVVLPDVFNPKLFRTGEFLARALDNQLIPPGAAVLDMGTGSGIGAIAASKWAKRVVAVDVNPAAVCCARINALLNSPPDRANTDGGGDDGDLASGLADDVPPCPIDVREGDLFAPVRGQRFDVVLFNPPFFRGEPRDLWDHAWRSPDVVERFAASLADHLAPGGHALVVLSSDGESASFLGIFAANGLAIDVVASHRYLNETLTTYRLRARENTR